jgi:hypothetical protein
MEETDMDQSMPSTTEILPQRTRRFRKRMFRRLPPPAPAVKTLWEQASEAEKQRAHQQGTTILQLWLGRLTKEQAMAELELPRLRLWQLSQQALSGMLAGLLKQPRTRAKGAVMPVDPENDPKALKKQIALLQKENAILRDVNEILKMLPGNREKVASKEAPAPRPKSKTRQPRPTPRVASASHRPVAQEPASPPAG